MTKNKKKKKNAEKGVRSGGEVLYSYHIHSP